MISQWRVANKDQTTYIYEQQPPIQRGHIVVSEILKSEGKHRQYEAVVERVDEEPC